MEHIFLLSYGSNMLFDRIQERIKSVEVAGTHELSGYELAFNKKSADGSTKANIVITSNPNDTVHGVVHKVHISDMPILDGFEKGYDLKHVGVSNDYFDNKLYTYIATDEYIEHGKPYDWYLNLVIAGARENELPRTYIRNLQTVNPVLDNNKDRSKKNFKLISGQSIAY